MPLWFPTLSASPHGLLPSDSVLAWCKVCGGVCGLCVVFADSTGGMEVSSGVDFGTSKSY